MAEKESRVGEKRKTKTKKQKNKGKRAISQKKLVPLHAKNTHIILTQFIYESILEKTLRKTPIY